MYLENFALLRIFVHLFFQTELSFIVVLAFQLGLELEGLESLLWLGLVLVTKTVE